jgi:putative PIN family toxin of toxin-antitoxin system
LRAVLDTNVLVSALLSPGKTCHQLIQQAVVDRVEVCYSTAIMAEYLHVLSRASFAFDPVAVDALLDWIERDGLLVQPAAVPLLADPSDTKFMEAAVGAGALYLVTGNLKHFPPSPFLGVKILAPAEFLKLGL